MKLRARTADGFLLGLRLQLGNRLPLFAVVDGALLVAGLLEGLLGGGEPRSLYLQVVLLPPLLVGLPALADLVALERRAGSLDLALATPDPESYFLRRAASVGAVLLQAAAVLLALWISEGFGFPILLPLFHAAACSALLLAAASFWAVRVETAGGVWFSTLATLGAFGRWYFVLPIPERTSASASPFFAATRETLSGAVAVAILAAAALLFHSYARRRLARPEKLLT